MEKIWLKSYPKNVSAEVNLNAHQSLVELFEKSCLKYRSKIAYQSFGTALRFGELDDLSKNFAAYLQKELRLKKGTRVAVMLPNLLQYPVVMYGILRAGMIVVNVNPQYTARELEYQLKDSGVEAIIIFESVAHVLQEVLAVANVKYVIVTQIGDLMPAPKGALYNFMVKYIKRMIPNWQIPSAIRFKNTLEAGANLAFDRVNVKSDDTAFLQYTGGTTGISKGAMLSHGNMNANVEQLCAWIGKDVREGEEVVVTALPLYHIFSLLANCLAFTKLGGNCVLITDPRDMKSFIKLLSQIPFSVFLGVNTLFNALLSQREFAALDFSHLRFCVGGGMAIQSSVAKAWQKVTKRTLIEGYGLTETSPIVSVNLLNLEEYNGSIGLPLPSTDISIRDANGDEVPIGEAGELYVKGPQVMKGYWRQTDETKKVLDDDGWLATGDVAKLDEKGLIYLVDRKKDVIIVSGFNVYPNEVEEVAMQYPGVLEVAAVGKSHNQCGEVVKLFIVTSEGQVRESDLLAHCKKYLTGYKIPKEIEFREQLPKSNVGKILRRELRE